MFPRLNTSWGYLGVKLTFEEHIKNVFNKTNKTIGLLRKLCDLLPRQALVNIYKAFVRPYLDYGDVVYDQAFNSFFHAKMEFIQYNACLEITGAIRSTSREKIYHELGLQYLQLRPSLVVCFAATQRDDPLIPSPHISKHTFHN